MKVPLEGILADLLECKWTSQWATEVFTAQVKQKTKTTNLALFLSVLSLVFHKETYSLSPPLTTTLFSTLIPYLFPLFRTPNRQQKKISSLQTPNFVRATVFIFILGLGPICDEFRIWASNLVHFYFIESSSHLVFQLFISCLFRI